MPCLAIKNLLFVRLFLPAIKRHIKIRYYRSWNLIDIRCNMAKIWLGFTFSIFSKKFKFIIQFIIYFLKVVPSLVDIERTTLINFAKSCANHPCFCFIKCYLKYIFGCSFRNISSIVNRMTRGKCYFFLMQCTKKSFPYANRFANTIKFSWVTQSDV